MAPSSEHAFEQNHFSVDVLYHIPVVYPHEHPLEERLSQNRLSVSCKDSDIHAMVSRWLKGTVEWSARRLKIFKYIV